MGIVQIAKLKQKNRQFRWRLFYKNNKFFGDGLFRRLFILDETVLASILNQLVPVI
jgi:hypothetical protein